MAGTVTQVHHRISVDLDTPQPFTDICGDTRKVIAVRIEYVLSAIADRVDVVVEYRDCARLVPPVSEIPDWMQALIDEHRPDGPVCQLH